MMTYKVVELNPVTDDAIEMTLNTLTMQGWTFESLHFAMGAGSHRPAMAFMFFVRAFEVSESSNEREKE